MIHYLDDFLFIGAPNTEECGSSLSQAVSKCHDLGVRISLGKLEGQAETIVFSGNFVRHRQDGSLSARRKTEEIATVAGRVERKVLLYK